MKEKGIPLFFPVRVKRCVYCSYISSIWFTDRPWSYCDYWRHTKHQLLWKSTRQPQYSQPILIYRFHNQCGAVRYGTAKGEYFFERGQPPYCPQAMRTINSRPTVILPSVEVIKIRCRARKSASGFDTTKVFVDTEGTFGIITEVTIHLAPLVPTPSQLRGSQTFARSPSSRF